jgi:hypothetical protein
MDSQRIFNILLTIILSLILFIFTLKLVFNTDKINEGKFRLIDAVVASVAELVDKTDVNNAWSLNVSQRNTITLLIMPASDAKISRIYLSEIKTNSKNPIEFYALNDENRITLNNEPQRLNLDFALEENGQVRLDLVALNENVLRDWRVPAEIKEILCDGRIFNVAGMSLKDLQFNLQFTLNIVETNGKLNTLKMNINLPTKYLLENGIDVRRLDRTEFKFKVN